MVLVIPQRSRTPCFIWRVPQEFHLARRKGIEHHGAFVVVLLRQLAIDLEHCMAATVIAAAAGLRILKSSSVFLSGL
jgi:hypothetical protein